MLRNVQRISSGAARHAMLVVTGSLLLTLALLLQPASAQSTENFDALVAWLSGFPGFEHHVRVGVRPDGIRGIFVTEDIPEGGAIMKLPAEAVMPLGGAVQDNEIVEPVIRMLEHLKNPHSRFRPYMDTMPAPDQVLCTCNMPEELWGMAPEEWRSDLKSTLDVLKGIIEGKNEKMVVTLAETLGEAAANMTLEDVQYACALSVTRSLDGSPRETTLMLPLFDLCNHKDNCSNFVGAYGNHFDEDGFFYLVANESLKEGDEVCYGYRLWMRDDDALFTYGYLPSKEERPFVMESVKDGEPLRWPMLYTDIEPAEAEDEEKVGPSAEFGKEFQGDSEQTKTEIFRLKGLLDGIEEREKTFTNPPVKPGLEYAHSLLLELQKRRKLALQAQIKALEAALVE